MCRDHEQLWMGWWDHCRLWKARSEADSVATLPNTTETPSWRRSTVDGWTTSNRRRHQCRPTYGSAAGQLTMMNWSGMHKLVCRPHTDAPRPARRGRQYRERIRLGKKFLVPSYLVFKCLNVSKNLNVNSMDVFHARRSRNILGIRFIQVDMSSICACLFEA